MSHSARSLTEFRPNLDGCERFETCVRATQHEMIGRRVCMPVLQLLGGLSVTTPEENVSAACNSVRTGAE